MQNFRILRSFAALPPAQDDVLRTLGVKAHAED
jgi:hypothetical protein